MFISLQKQSPAVKLYNQIPVDAFLKTSDFITLWVLWLFHFVLVCSWRKLSCQQGWSTRTQRIPRTWKEDNAQNPGVLPSPVSPSWSIIHLPLLAHKLLSLWFLIFVIVEYWPLSEYCASFWIFNLCSLSANMDGVDPSNSENFPQKQSFQDQFDVTYLENWSI